jgi:small-conductance mechanosensitive channel
VVKQRLVGDTVSVAGVTGEILEVNLSACIIFSTEHETVTVPNAKVWGQPNSKCQ